MLRFDRMDMAAREREWSRPEPPRLPDKDELDDALGRIRQVLDAANQATGRAFDLDTPATSQAYGHYFYLMCLALRMYPEASRRGTTPEERTVLTAQVIDQLERITNDPTERPEHREFAHERITFLRERSGEK